MIKYERIITGEEQKILEHDLIDIKEWIDKAIEGKINNCLKRAAIQSREISKQEGAEFLIANDTAAANKLFTRKDYLNRQQREQLSK